MKCFCTLKRPALSSLLSGVNCSSSLILSQCQILQYFHHFHDPLLDTGEPRTESRIPGSGVLSGLSGLRRGRRIIFFDPSAVWQIRQNYCRELAKEDSTYYICREDYEKSNVTACVNDSTWLHQNISQGSFSTDLFCLVSFSRTIAKTWHQKSNLPNKF